MKTIIELIFGIQMLGIGVLGAYLIQSLTGASNFVSGIVGFILAWGVFWLIFYRTPRLVLLVLVMAYAYLGYNLSLEFSVSLLGTFVWVLAIGGFGWAANAFGLGEHFKEAEEAKKEKKENAIKNNPSKYLLKDEKKAELFQDAVIAYQCGLISQDLYKDICDKINKYAIEEANIEQPLPVSRLQTKALSEFNLDDKIALINLRELYLIQDADGWPGIADEMEDALHANEQRLKEDRDKQIRAAEFSGPLFDLAESRAISMRTFLRAMLEVDEDYPPTAAKIENFPKSKPKPDAMKQLKALYKAKLIDVDEYQQAAEVIEAYI